MRGMVGSGVAASYDYDGEGRRFLIDEPDSPRRIQVDNTEGMLLSENGIHSTSGVTELNSHLYNGCKCHRQTPVEEKMRLIPRLYVDFNNRDIDGMVMLNTARFLESSSRPLELSQGTIVLAMCADLAALARVASPLKGFARAEILEWLTRVGDAGAAFAEMNENEHTGI